MSESRLARRTRVGLRVLVGCVAFALLPSALPASAKRTDRAATTPGQKTIAWDGQATVTTRDIPTKGSSPTTYKITYSWHLTWEYDVASKTFRPPTTTGKVTGTASRASGGGSSADCSGPVTGSVEAPVATLDKAGNVVFDASGIPGFPGGGVLYACFGSAIPPVFPQMSRASFAFHARTKLGPLLGGSGSASDKKHDENTSTFQGSICTKGCIAATPASTGGFTPIVPTTKPTPNPSDPIYTYEASVSWNAKVSLDTGPQQYVALGDSYSAADGAIPGGVTSYADLCHHTRQSYPYLLGIQVKRNMACSGATIDTMSRAFKGQEAQLSALGPETTLVTLTIGGNDVKMFALTDCMTTTLFKLLSANGVTNAILQGLFGCQGRYGSQVDADVKALPAKLAKLYEAIHTKAPQARLLVLEYPNPFPAGKLQTFCASQLGQANVNFGGVAIPTALMIGIDHADFPFLFKTINNINQAIHQAVALAATDGWAPTVVPMSGAGVDFEAHNICKFNSWFWGFRADKKGDPLGATLHPNLDGNSEMAELVKKQADL